MFMISVAFNSTFKILHSNYDLFFSNLYFHTEKNINESLQFCYNHSGLVFKSRLDTFCRALARN